MILAWHHLLFEIPANWEVIAYTKNPEDGQLVLSDRHGETMQVFWKRMKERPALANRLIELARANGDEDAKLSDLCDVARWQVHLPRDPKSPAFAGRFLEDNRVLLNVTFPPHPNPESGRSTRSVLESFRPNNGMERHWAALGLEFTLPVEMELDTVQALPARQVMSFASKHGDTVAIHRYGMLPLILAEEDMATFFARIKGRKCLLHRGPAFRKDGIELGYKTRGSGGLTQLLGRARVGRVWLWRCDDLQRLFCIDHCAHKDRLMEGLVERVKCCSNHPSRKSSGSAGAEPSNSPIGPLEGAAPAAPRSSGNAWGSVPPISQPTTTALAQIQLDSKPVRNETTLARVVADGNVRLTLPLDYGAWSKAVRLVLPLSKETNLELDRLGADILALCDGQHTVEQIIDAHKDRWKLSFFESRAMILPFLQYLMRHNFIVMVTPDENPTEARKR